MAIQIEKIHHVAYRCKDAKETVEWYKKNLNMDFILAFAEDHVPSTKAFDPYMHLFLDAGNGNVLAFFELPTQPEMGRDENTPKWVQHIALKVKDRAALIEAKEHLEANGVDVLGITNHGIFHSIYFFDPNGHRLELAYDDEKAPEKIALITEEMKHEMLEEWSKTKRAPHHTHFLHADELENNSADAKVDH
ncbi:glyoxalase (plasmid) [Acinetobacter sp. NCu2D-2]|uniref:VOC family protein n=1 Tax=Acinetobacter sp. NCu2D-2 TaxID=1608473 RepID=UPI0007CD9EEC|nr:VOC family protein [Acinetobacter sp. NCu2D-2]ANF83206.1 glyoxalase [Acinetobacter sp. NCu2D-2]